MDTFNCSIAAPRSSTLAARFPAWTDPTQVPPDGQLVPGRSCARNRDGRRRSDDTYIVPPEPRLVKCGGEATSNSQLQSQTPLQVFHAKRYPCLSMGLQDRQVNEVIALQGPLGNLDSDILQSDLLVRFRVEINQTLRAACAGLCPGIRSLLTAPDGDDPRNRAFAFATRASHD
jgi:hypothetical protein